MYPLRIFLSENSLDDQIFFSLALTATKIKCDLIIVNDGQKLMEKLTTEAVTPDLIFMDINMPRKNGLECLMEIRHDKRLLTVPVIILSAGSQKMSIDITYELGANMYLGKPNKLERLVSMLREILLFDWATTPRLVPENFSRF
jgi:CheY-like chemotaxis protein